MNKVSELVEKVLISTVNVEEGIEQIRRLLREETDQASISRTTCVLRLFRCLEEVAKGRGSYFDFAAHLRQYILYFNRVKVDQKIASHLTRIADDFALVIDQDNEVNARRSYPDWFKNPEALDIVYNLQPRRQVQKELGDGILAKMTGYSYYKSSAQKAIIHASMNMREGYTLLACLPTGGGKSLVGQLPVYYETEGGTLSGSIVQTGTTIVVVPTVALALDQEKAVRKYFQNALDDEHRPTAYYSSLPDAKKQVIYKGIRQGTLPLLYTSPEALLNGRLYEACLEAARRQRLNRLIIDETHIVNDWGDSFRTDFQLLAPFRRKLLLEGDNRLKTILLSATLPDQATTVLKELFSEEGRFIEIRGDSLRPELMFWVDRSKTKKEREEKILNIFPLLPRPLILYVLKPEFAKDWVRLIREKGFKRIETFTGETSDREREHLLERWNADEIDIMVATSAFGMGVDKRDIRTVVHCCLPESVNRFYQEVGRTGRDGFASISLFSAVPKEDYKDTFNLLKSNLPTSSTISERWEAMRKRPAQKVDGDSFWVDTDTPPPHLEEKTTGRKNANWNEVVLLFLYRKGFIDILDFRKNDVTYRRQILVRMLQLNALSDENTLQKEVEPDREAELQHTVEQLKEIQNLSYNDTSCWAEFFSNTYRYTTEICGGCPKCRKEGVPPSRDQSSISIYGAEVFKENEFVLSGKLHRIIGKNSDLLVYLTESQYQAEDLVLVKIAAELIRSGVRNIVLPTMTEELWKHWITDLPCEDVKPYSIYLMEELAGAYERYLSGPVAVFYPLDEEEVSWFYRWTEKYRCADKKNQIIHVALNYMYVPYLKRDLNEVVETLLKGELLMESSKDVENSMLLF